MGQKLEIAKAELETARERYEEIRERKVTSRDAYHDAVAQLRHLEDALPRMRELMADTELLSDKRKRDLEEAENNVEQAKIEEEIATMQARLDGLKRKIGK